MLNVTEISACFIIIITCFEGFAKTQPPCHTVVEVEAVCIVCARILQVCHVVFFKQLSTWLLHGSLHDQYSEFFITCATESVLSSTDANLSASDDFDVAGVTGSELSIVMASFIFVTFAVIVRRAC